MYKIFCLIILVNLVNPLNWESLCEVTFTQELECIYFDFDNDQCLPYDVTNCHILSIEYNSLYCPTYNCEVNIFKIKKQ